MQTIENCRQRFFNRPQRRVNRRTHFDWGLTCTLLFYWPSIIAIFYFIVDYAVNLIRNSQALELTYPNCIDSNNEIISSKACDYVGEIANEMLIKTMTEDVYHSLAILAGGFIAMLMILFVFSPMIKLGQCLGYSRSPEQERILAI